MRLRVRFTASLLAVAFLSVASCAVAQTSSTASSTTTGNYIAIDPLAKVNYNNRYDVSLGMAYQHLKAGPNIVQGANLGGLDLSGSYWLTKHWAVEGTGRALVGTSGAAPNTQSINGPFVSEYVAAVGPEWLGPHNKHADLMAHVLVGGAYGKFEQDLRGNSPSVVDFYNDQFALAWIVGGHVDLNRSEHWVFRITPDALFTNYGIDYGPKIHQVDVNFGISVGLEYKFKKKR